MKTTQILKGTPVRRSTIAYTMIGNYCSIDGTVYFDGTEYIPVSDVSGQGEQTVLINGKPVIFSRSVP